MNNIIRIINLRKFAEGRVIGVNNQSEMSFGEVSREGQILRLKA